MKNHSLIEEAGVGTTRAAGILDEALAGADDGEIFIESVRSESFLFDDGRLKSASYDSGQGFGLRVVSGDRCFGCEARTRGNARCWTDPGKSPALRGRRSDRCA